MNGRKTVTLEHFAVFRELRDADRETVDTTARTAAELYEEMRRRAGFPLPLETVRVAVDDEFTSWSHELRDGDRITFIAPVAGG